MSRTGANFVQADLSRTLRACRDAGVLDQVVVRVEKDAFVIVPLAAAGSAAAQGGSAPMRARGDDLPDLPEI